MSRILRKFFYHELWSAVGVLHIVWYYTEELITTKRKHSPRRLQSPWISTVIKSSKQGQSRRENAILLARQMRWCRCR